MQLHVCITLHGARDEVKVLLGLLEPKLSASRATKPGLDASSVGKARPWTVYNLCGEITHQCRSAFAEVAISPFMYWAAIQSIHVLLQHGLVTSSVDWKNGSSTFPCWYRCVLFCTFGTPCTLQLARLQHPHPRIWIIPKNELSDEEQRAESFSLDSIEVV